MKLDRIFATPQQAIDFSVTQLIDEYIAYWSDDVVMEDHYDTTPVDVLKQLRDHIADGKKPGRYNYITFVHEEDGRVNMKYKED